jgi:hypothetical protein
MIKNNEHVPYTYLIGWTKHDKWYYGVRYAKHCDPTDLWITYFTSSDYVRRFVEEFGQPDVIQIRKTFDAVDDARKWEERVLRRMRVVLNERWINKTDIVSIDPRCVPRGDKHWTRQNTEKAESHKNRLAEWIKNPENSIVVSGDNHYTRQESYVQIITKDNYLLKSPEALSKVTGDNHYTHRPGYDNSNHYAKRSEAKEALSKRNSVLFTGYKHKMKLCGNCQKEIPANNYPQHIRKCLLFVNE